MPDNQQLYIPSRLKIGFQRRDDCFTKMLAYVTYLKGKVLAKERSWEGWRDKKIKPVEYDNTPTEGFVLNKKVGGHRTEWNYRDAHVRVYDPRGFEFEISVPNLLFILSTVDCSRGKGLEGACVYGWDKSELVLIPTASDEYRKSQAFTDLQSKRVVGKELIPGATYLTKKQEELVYVGRYDHYFAVYTGAQSRYYKNSAEADKKGVVKKYIFWKPDWKKPKTAIDAEDAFEHYDGLSKIGALKSDVPHPKLAELVTEYGKSPHGSRVVSLRLKPGKPLKDGHYRDEKIWYAEDKPGVFVQFATNNEWNSETVRDVDVVAAFRIEDGVLIRERQDITMYPPGKQPVRRRSYNYSTGKYDDPEVFRPWQSVTNMQLFATLENGTEVQVGYANFDKKKG